MNTKTTIKNLSRLLLGGSVLLLPSLTEAAKKQDRPNILWITLEDTSPHFIGSYGNKHVKTPVMDKLANDGVRFTNAFATGTVCSSSRSTIITGCRTEAIGTGHHRSTYPLPEFIKGFPTYMREVGYYTTNNAKKDYNTSNDARITKSSWYESSKNAGWWNREDGQPFFSIFNFENCHQSRTMTKPWDWYEKAILNKLEPEDRTSPDEIEVPPFYRDSPEMRKHLSRVYNSLNYTDIQIGELLARLEAEGLKENTIIFCYADHGEGIPKGKCNPMGLGYQVPFFIWFPEKYRHLSPWENGKPSGELICFEDLAPTLISLVGGEIPEYMKGRPFLGEKREDPREFVFGSRNRLDESPDLSRSVTDGQYMYTRVFMPQYPIMKFQKYSDVADITKCIRKDYKAGLLNEAQSELVKARPVEYLFDLKNDKWEINNLAGKEQVSGVLKKMRKALFQNIDEVRDVHFLPEYELDKLSKETTAFEYRQNEKQYDLKSIVAATDLVGQGKKVVKKQFKLLNDSNPIVRYWAAVGLHTQGENVKNKKSEILDGLNDEYPCVRIEMAALAWELFQEPKAGEVLIEYVSGDNIHLALQSLLSLEYMGEKARKFIPEVRRIKAQYANIKNDRFNVYNIQCCTELILYHLEGEILSY